MESAANAEPVIQKTRELCAAIAAHAAFDETRRKFDAFMENGDLRLKYSLLGERGRLLEMKQNSGLQLTDEEVREFHAQRDELLKNPLVHGFMEAQDEMRLVHDLINRYLTRTYDLGRVPTDAESKTSGDPENCNCGN